MIQSNKPLKKCNFCGKEVKNLGWHIANTHPSITARLDEGEQFDEIKTNSKKIESGGTPPPILATKTPQTINEMIRDKLDIMLNIKIIEMLSASNSPSLQDINSALNPPKEHSLEDLKKFHDLVYDRDPLDQISKVDTGNNWANVALQAMPIITGMMASRKQQAPDQEKKIIEECENNVRRGEETNTRILKPIQIEIAGNTREPTSIIPEPGTPGKTE